MFTSDPERLQQLERRVAELEQRMAALAARNVPASRPASPPPVAWVAPPTSRPSDAIAGVAEEPRSGGSPAPVRSRTLAELEEQLSSRLLAWVGGIALVVGAVFFLSLAFSRGWIGPEGRVLIGLAAGAAAFAAGGWLFERGQRTPATVLAGVGVGVESLALFAASHLYGFIPVEVALASFLLLAAVTATLALRAGSQAVAAFGLVATTMAPPVLGATPNLATVAFLGAALVGTAIISFGRPWPWLALIAFVATAPQAASWFWDEDAIVVATVGLFLYWATNGLAAAGSSLAGLRASVHRASASLLVLNAMFAIGAIHGLLPLDPVQRSVALLVLATLHGLIAVPLLLQPSRRHPFGILAAGGAVGTLAIGMAIELGGIARPIGEMVLAAGVAWIAIRFRDRAAVASAGAIGSVALLDFVLVQYPLGEFGLVVPAGLPFVSPEGLVAIVIASGLLLIGVTGWALYRSTASRNPWVTADLSLVAGVSGAIATITYAAAFEFVADQRVIVWAILAVCAFGVAVFVERDRKAREVAIATGGALIGLASWLALANVAAPTRLLVDSRRSSAIVPFLNGETLALLAIAAALGVGAWLAGRSSRTRPFSPAREPVAGATAAASGGVVVYAFSIAIVDVFQARLGSGGAADEIATQAQVALSIAWVLIGAGLFATGLVQRIPLARFFGLGLLSLATAKVFLFDLASLDVAYRVLSFIGLGGVLLASSFVAARFRTSGRLADTVEPPAADASAAADQSAR